MNNQGHQKASPTCARTRATSLRKADRASAPERRRPKLVKQAADWRRTTRNLAEQIWHRLIETKPARLPRSAEAIWGWAGDGTVPEYDILRSNEGEWFFRVIDGGRRTVWRISLAEGMVILAHAYMPAEFWATTGAEALLAAGTVPRPLRGDAAARAFRKAYLRRHK